MWKDCLLTIKYALNFLLTKQKMRIQHLGAPQQSYVKNWYQTSLSTLEILEKTVKKLNAQLVGIGGSN